MQLVRVQRDVPSAGLPRRRGLRLLAQPRGDVAGAWRAFDEDLSGYISLKETLKHREQKALGESLSLLKRAYMPHI